MVEFSSKNLNLQAWDEFSELGPDRPISLLHVGMNDCVIYITENDDVYVVPSKVHRRVSALSGRCVTQFASTLSFIVAGTDENEIFFVGKSEVSLQNGDYLMKESPDPEFHLIYSVIPKYHDGCLSLLDCAAHFTVTYDKTRNDLVVFVQHFEQSEGMKTIIIGWRDKKPPMKLTCGLYHAAVLGFNTKAYIFGMDTVEGYRKHQGPFPFKMSLVEVPLPSPAKDVACGARGTVAFLLSNGEVLFKAGTACPLTRMACPILAEITSNKVFFAASTESAIIRFGRRGKPTIYEGETNLLKAFEGHCTPRTLRAKLSEGSQHAETGLVSFTRTDFINDCYDNEFLSDVTLTLKDGQIRAHKVILSAYSKHFETLFRSDVCGTYSSLSSPVSLDVSSYNPVAYTAYVKFIYSGLVEWSEIMHYDELVAIYNIAVENDETFKKYMLSTLLDSMNPQNMCEIFKFAAEFNLKTIQDRCLQFARNHTKEMFVSESFTRLPFDLKCRLTNFSLD